MAKVILRQFEAHARWQVGEIVTVQVTDDETPDGDYICETLETYPADIKERHRAEVERLVQNHRDQLEAALAVSAAPSESAK